MKLNTKTIPTPSREVSDLSEKNYPFSLLLRQAIKSFGGHGIKVNDLKLTVLIIVSLFVLGQAFLTLAEEKNNPESFFLDSDQDGLSDEEEKLYGTNSQNPDTDGDSYSDGNEVKSGYDPTKPAPGDKVEALSQEPSVKGIQDISTSARKNENLTDKLSEQMLDFMNLGGNLEDTPEELTTDDIRSFTQNFLNAEVPEQEFPQISVQDLKIKKQDYSKLSAEEAQQKRNEDFSNYVISIFYILSLNSSQPITTADEFNASFARVGQEIASAIIESDQKYFTELKNQGRKILEQMKNVEVPEDLLEIHLKMLSLAGYGTTLNDDFAVLNQTDPALSLVNLSRAQSFFETVSNFYSEAQNKFSQYTLDESYVQSELQKLGIE